MIKCTDCLWKKKRSKYEAIVWVVMVDCKACDWTWMELEQHERIEKLKTTQGYDEMHRPVPLEE